MNTSGRLYGLDGLRGIAAVSVVLFHAHATFAAFPNWWPRGYLAVDFFMMLSGYVMARTYEDRMRGGLGTGAFVALRYRRLWLTMAVGGLLGIPYLWALAGEPVKFVTSLVLNLALVPAPIQNELFPLNGPAWSIFFELVANAIHAALLWRLSSRSLIAVAAAMLALLAVYARLKGDIDFGSLTPHVGLGVIRSLSAYILGVLLWRWWRDEPTIKVPALLPFLALPLLLLIPEAVIGWPFDIGFVVLACPLLMAGGLRLNGAPRWALWSGMLSFPLYAVHIPVLRAGYLAGLNPVFVIVLAIATGVVLTWWLSARQRRAKAPAKI